MSEKAEFGRVGSCQDAIRCLRRARKALERFREEFDDTQEHVLLAMDARFLAESVMKLAQSIHEGGSRS